jgi:hypothetical protein
MLNGISPELRQGQEGSSEEKLSISISRNLCLAATTQARNLETLLLWHQPMML